MRVCEHAKWCFEGFIDKFTSKALDWVKGWVAADFFSFHEHCILLTLSAHQ